MNLGVGGTISQLNVQGDKSRRQKPPGMFHHPAWAVRSYKSSPPAARSVGTKSTGGFHHSSVSPCTLLVYEPCESAGTWLFWWRRSCGPSG